MKRHFLIHIRERDFVCPHEGCGKVINLSNGNAYSRFCEGNLFIVNDVSV